MEELRKCPVCGEDPSMVFREEDEIEWYVECKVCSIAGPTQDGEWFAAKEWNYSVDLYLERKRAAEI